MGLALSLSGPGHGIEAMAIQHLMFLSIPGLRPRDVTAEHTPVLHAWSQAGAMAELTPSFPCVTSPVQATMLTGRPPGDHGVIANGFFYRDRDEIEFWVAHNDVIEGTQIWDTIRRARPDWVSAAWHTQNIKNAGADFIVTPSPIHEEDGTTKLWCYSKPDGIYETILADLGHFPLQHYWGPMSGIQSTAWILDAAVWLHERHRPHFHWIYVPQLDYAAQKHGPDSPQALEALQALDQVLATFRDRVLAGDRPDEVAFLAVGEYAMTRVNSVVYPNRQLRDAGMIAMREQDGIEWLDLPASRAFAMVDHQFAHVYVREERDVVPVAELFRSMPGIQTVLAGDDRAEVGMCHMRAGDVVLIADENHWLAYYWWLEDSAAPPFARTVDIHAKPGYDPMEMFIDRASGGISLDATLICGSHGVPATSRRHRTAVIASHPTDALGVNDPLRDTDIPSICLSLLGIETRAE